MAEPASAPPLLDPPCMSNGPFVPTPPIEPEPYEKLWQMKVFDLLLKSGKVDESLVRQMAGWEHRNLGLCGAPGGDRRARRPREARTPALRHAALPLQPGAHDPPHRGGQGALSARGAAMRATSTTLCSQRGTASRRPTCRTGWTTAVAAPRPGPRALLEGRGVRGGASPPFPGGPGARSTSGLPRALSAPAHGTYHQTYHGGVITGETSFRGEGGAACFGPRWPR